MTSLLSVYWSALHGQAEGLEYIRRLQPRDVLILDPDVQHVIDAHEASPESEITLRHWEWDDGRTKDNQHGVYKRIADDPEGAADWVIANYMSMVTAMEAEARRRGRRFPAREQLTLHLANEPDTNYILPALNRYTMRACQQVRQHGVLLDCLNLSTGHPVHLDANRNVDWSQLAGALDAITAGRHYAVVHEYYNSLGITDPLVYPWHIGRHAKWAPRGPRWKIGEFGVEEILNLLMEDHHGWQGRISPDQMVGDTDWYLGQTRDDVKAVRIFMTGFADRRWRTFDTDPVRDRLVAVGQRYPSEREPTQTHTVHIPAVIAPQPQPPVVQPSVKQTLDTRVMEAVAQAESGRRAFGQDGRLIVRVEAHLLLSRQYGKPDLFEPYFAYTPNNIFEAFYRQTPQGPWIAYHGDQRREHEALALARRLHNETALRCTSMGAGQVMGFNAGRVGFTSAQEMFDVMSRSESSHYVAMCNYMLSDPALHAAVNARDWPEIGRRYNGSASAGEKYRATYIALWG